MQPSSRNQRKRYQPMAEINVTPMVDIMLVLLIVFMVAAPLLTVGVPVNLPKAGAKPLRGDEEPLALAAREGMRIAFEHIGIQPHPTQHFSGLVLTCGTVANSVNFHGFGQGLFDPHPGLSDE